MINQEEKIEIIYISSVCSEKVYKDLENSVTKPMKYSIQKFHNLIIEGISRQKSTSITALCGLPIDRANTKNIIFNKKTIVNENIKYIHIGFFNIPIIKQINICFGMIIELFRWYKKNKNNPNKIIICDSSYVTVTPAVVFFAKILKLKNIAIVADIYGYMSDRLENRGKINTIKKIITKMCMYCWKNYDGFILLTQQMNQIVNDNKKPYIIMEGIASKKIEEENALKKENYIMYARWTTLQLWNKRFS